MGIANSVCHGKLALRSIVINMDRQRDKKICGKSNPFKDFLTFLLASTQYIKDDANCRYFPVVREEAATGTPLD